MLHPLRLRSGKRIYLFIAMLSFLILTGCATTSPVTVDPPTTPEPSAYVMTVTLSPTDTPSSVEQQYGGRVIAWEEAAYAIVASNKKLEGSAGAKVTVETNTRAFRGGGVVGMNGRSRLWSGGRSRLWSGGRSRLWSGGGVQLWSGGSFTWMPENTALWQQVRLEQGQALAPNLGYGVKVAVLDTGLDLEHPALKEALAPANEWWDFYSNDALPQEGGSFTDAGYGHGTNVAGIIRQIAPRATILPVRVLGPDGEGDVVMVAAGIQWAISKGANVINLSLGSDSSFTAIENLIKQATSKGIFVIASTGNSADTKVTWPASSATGNALRLSVTSVDGFDKKSSFATYGASVELAAPGELVYGPAPELNMAAWSGTSQAAPIASGALALALGQTLNVSKTELAEELCERGANLYSSNLNDPYKDKLGEGRLDLEDFLESVVR